MAPEQNTNKKSTRIADPDDHGSELENFCMICGAQVDDNDEDNDDVGDRMMDLDLRRHWQLLKDSEAAAQKHNEGADPKSEQ